MFKKSLFLFVLIVFLSVGCVAASDSISANSTTDVDMDFLSADINESDSIEYIGEDMISDGDSPSHTAISNSPNDSFKESDDTMESTFFSLKSQKIKTEGIIEVCMTDSNGNAVQNRNVTLLFDNANHTVSTDKYGIASLKIGKLPSKAYELTATFLGDDDFSMSNKTFKFFLYKKDTKLIHISNQIIKGGNLYASLFDEEGRAVSGKKITIRIAGKNYMRTTSKTGQIVFRINLKPMSYAMIIKFAGDSYYNAISKNMRIYIEKERAIKIGNSKLLTGGFLKIYLKGPDISKKTLKIVIGNKEFTKTTNFEGWIVIKPNMKAGNYWIGVKNGKYQVFKKVSCIEGNPKDPNYYKIPLVNGKPDLDVMPADYVWGDGVASYTLTKSQYLEVMKRDSYCLFLKNKLTKYVFFKTKSYQKTNHVLIREKWNVIEKEVNKKLVSANRHGYWPGQVSVNLRGKSYTYPEVRDPQDTDYTCGPTSCSMCSQVLKNYYCESYLAKLSGTVPHDGTACSGMVSAMEKLNFKCTYFYKSSFLDSVNELRKGGCAVVFHTKNHYVALLDISSDGRYFLVSNSYGSFYNIPSKWLSCSYMKTRYYKNYDDGLIVRLNYQLSDAMKKHIDSYYASMGSNWAVHNTHEVVS